MVVVRQPLEVGDKFQAIDIIFELEKLLSAIYNLGEFS